MMAIEDRSTQGPPKADAAPQRQVQPFDALIAALRNDVAHAQQSLDRDYSARLQRTVDLNRDGHAESLSYFFNVVVPDGDGGTRTLRMPIVSMRPFTQHKIVEVSLELMASIEETPPDPVAITDAPDPPPLSLVVYRRGEALLRKLHRVFITFRGDQPEGGGEVTIDGLLLKKIAPSDRG